MNYSIAVLLVDIKISLLYVIMRLFEIPGYIVTLSGEIVVLINGNSSEILG